MTESARSEGIDVLNIVLDQLIPAHGALPGAGTMGLAPRVIDIAAQHAGRPERLLLLIEQLPPNFEQLAADARDEMLRGIELREPAGFRELVATAYSAYYTDDRVRAQIENATGYPARPAQPLGYDLDPFDASQLEPVRKRAPMWRAPS